jgi:hypothetical protein
MRFAPIALVIALLADASLARAGDPATAQVLFTEARRLMHEREFDKACPMLEESQRLDPGVGTQFNLADCYEHEGRTASAWALFLDVAATTKAEGQSAREQAARGRADALAPKLSRLSIVIPTSHAHGLQVRRDGDLVGETQWNIPIPVDPGAHTVEVTAPRRKAWRSSFVVGADPTTTALAIPDLERDRGEGVPPPTAPPIVVPEEAPAPPPESPAEPLGMQRTLALGLGGLAVVGLAVGTAYGLDSLAKHNDSEAGCAQDTCTPSAGATRDQAIHAGNASTVAFVIGLASAAGGAVLWLTAPTAGKRSATVGRARGEVSVGIAGAPGGGLVFGRF